MDKGIKILIKKILSETINKKELTLEQSYSIEDKIKSVSELVKDLTFSDKMRLIFSIVPEKYFRNFKYREIAQLEDLGLKDDRGFRAHGPDSEKYSLKSASLTKKKKNGNYSITLCTSLGQFGRVDKIKTEDIKDTICTVYDNNNKLLTILIKYDDNFQKMYDTIRQEKQKKMMNNHQTMDSVNINFRLIKDYGLNYEILYKNEKVELNLNNQESC
jgi:hypothetical protein